MFSTGYLNDFSVMYPMHSGAVDAFYAAHKEQYQKLQDGKTVFDGLDKDIADLDAEIARLQSAKATIVQTKNQLVAEVRPISDALTAEFKAMAKSVTRPEIFKKEFDDYMKGTDGTKYNSYQYFCSRDDFLNEATEHEVMKSGLDDQQLFAVQASAIAHIFAISDKVYYDSTFRYMLFNQLPKNSDGSYIFNAATVAALVQRTVAQYLMCEEVPLPDLDAIFLEYGLN